MEWKTLILGIGMSMGVFGVKAGAGLYGGLREGSADGYGRKIFFMAAGYALIFGLLAAVLRTVHRMDSIDVLMRWLRAGMLVHVVLAILMLTWGLMLKRSRTFKDTHRNGWWLLVVPCPACMTVVGIGLAFVMALFPGAVLKSVALLYFGFLGVIFGTVFALSRWARWFGHQPEEILADAMIFLSVYFLLSVVVMPQFAGIEEVSRMGERSLQTTPMTNRLSWLGMGLAVSTAFAGGYVHTRRRRISVSAQPACDEKHHRAGLSASFRWLKSLGPSLTLDRTKPDHL